MSNEPSRTLVYTDGACSGNPGPGGWAWIVPDGPYSAGPERETTNQRMELMAALQAVRELAGPLEIRSDSTYVVNCFRDRWWESWRARGWVNSRRQPVANRDLWEPLVDEVLAGDVELTWVKGHSGDRWNDLADLLAVEAATRQEARSGPTTPTVEVPDKRQATRPTLPSGDPTGREPPPGRRVVVVGQRPSRHGSIDPDGRVLRRLREVLAAKQQMHPDLVVLTGLRLGAEQLGAEAARAAGIPFVAVLPYPDPASSWPSDERERFTDLTDAAADVIVLQAKVPDTKEKAKGAVGRRDAWFARNAHEAVVVWDHTDEVTGRTVRSFNDALGEDEVWVIDPAELPGP